MPVLEAHVAQRRPFWLWPNLLSLDAPVVAVLWQWFLAHRFSIPLRPAAQLVLGLTVWAIYLLDRLLDARTTQHDSREPERHRFYRRHWSPMATVLVIVCAADAGIALLWMRAPILRAGLVPAAGVLLYLVLFHSSGKRFAIPKELAVAILFTAGTFLAPWTTLPCPRLAWAALAFFALCLANLIAIEAWEWRELPTAMPHPYTRWLAKTYTFWVPVTGIVCLMLGRNEWYTSVAASATACALLFWTGRRISLEARRALVDGVLLSPLLFLLLR
ncbi:MAG TPA: hypothetical protein VFW44_17750 [Bryobacteraceae bacterium]|nr:hypothetical protein [Bryobacteraceae bacterium]